MILWLTIAQIVIAVAAGIFCLVAGLIGRRPSDFSVGALALVEVLLIVQVIVAIVAPLTGNPPTGDLLEYWVLPGLRGAPARRRGAVGAHGAQSLEHGDPRGGGARDRGDAVAYAGHLVRPDRVTRRVGAQTRPLLRL